MSSPISGTSWRVETDARGIRTLWFDQPGRPLNLLDRPSLDELESHLADIEATPSIRGCIIRGAKPGGFCAGMDLSAVLGCLDAGEVEDLVRRGLAAIDRLTSLEVPTVAVLHGACIGGGVELALACRRRVALASAAPLRAGFPGVHLGLVPAWGGISRLPRTIHRFEAVDMLLNGRSIGYLRARSLGLVDRLASGADPAQVLDPGPTGAAPDADRDEEPWESVLEKADQRMADTPGAYPDVQRRILSLVEIDLESGPTAAREAAVHAFAELALSPATRKAIERFLQHKGIPEGYEAG